MRISFSVRNASHARVKYRDVCTSLARQYCDDCITSWCKI